MMKKSLRILVYCFTVILFVSSCESDDNTTNPSQPENKMIFDGVEYPIAKAVSYTELRPSTQDYFFDITFLTANTEIGTTEDFRGNGTIFDIAFINETNTFLSSGQYEIAPFPASNYFDIYYCELFVDYDFTPALGNISYDFSLQEGYYDVTQNIIVLVSRNESTYTITGAGVTDDGRTFSLQFTGTLEVDPDSE